MIQLRANVTFVKTATGMIIKDASSFQEEGCPQSGDMEAFSKWMLSRKVKHNSGVQNVIDNVYVASFLLEKPELSTFCPNCGRIWWHNVWEACPKCRWGDVIVTDIEVEIAHFLFMLDLVEDNMSKLLGIGDDRFARTLQERILKLKLSRKVNDGKDSVSVE